MQDITNQKTVEKLRSWTKNLNKPIVFEILESESFLDYKILNNFVEEFKQYGVLFAIDDFGSGFSNYKEIINLKPHYLKIDGSLVKDINNSRNSTIIIQNILILTKMLGIKTVAEFVENKEIFQKLKVIGIDEFQGYYFSKPIPISSL
jgi:EAL domain-containing protein (putative c-di-GMP-specific phosphodiesterase class I)